MGGWMDGWVGGWVDGWLGEGAVDPLTFLELFNVLVTMRLCYMLLLQPPKSLFNTAQETAPFKVT